MNNTTSLDTLHRTVPTRPPDQSGMGKVGIAVAQTIGGVTDNAIKFAIGNAGGSLTGQLVAQTFGANGLTRGVLNGGFGTSQDVDPFQAQRDLLELQMAIQSEMQEFQMLTNISKTHHDGRMAAVRNMRP